MWYWCMLTVVIVYTECALWFQLWDIRRKGCIFTYKGHKLTVNSLKFSPDGQWIASAGEEGLVKVKTVILICIPNWNQFPKNCRVCHSSNSVGLNLGTTWFEFQPRHPVIPSKYHDSTSGHDCFLTNYFQFVIHWLTNTDTVWSEILTAS